MLALKKKKVLVSHDSDLLQSYFVPVKRTSGFILRLTKCHVSFYLFLLVSLLSYFPPLLFFFFCSVSLFLSAFICFFLYFVLLHISSFAFSYLSLLLPSSLPSFLSLYISFVALFFHLSCLSFFLCLFSSFLCIFSSFLYLFIFPVFLC